MATTTSSQRDVTTIVAGLTATPGSAADRRGAAAVDATPDHQLPGTVEAAICQLDESRTTATAGATLTNFARRCATSLQARLADTSGHDQAHATCSDLWQLTGDHHRPTDVDALEAAIVAFTAATSQPELAGIAATACRIPVDDDQAALRIRRPLPARQLDGDDLWSLLCATIGRDHAWAVDVWRHTGRTLGELLDAFDSTGAHSAALWAFEPLGSFEAARAYVEAIPAELRPIVGTLISDSHANPGSALAGQPLGAYLDAARLLT